MCGKSPGERTETKGRVSRPQAPFIEGDVQERADQATDEGESKILERDRLRQREMEGACERLIS